MTHISRGMSIPIILTLIASTASAQPVQQELRFEDIDEAKLSRMQPCETMKYDRGFCRTADGCELYKGVCIINDGTRTGNTGYAVRIKTCPRSKAKVS